MRILLAICAALLVIAGVVIANTRGDLQVERKLNAALQAQLVDARESASVPVVLSQSAVVLPAPANGASVSRDKSPDSAPGAKAPQPDNGNSAAEIAGKAMSKAMLADPEYQSAQLANLRMNMSQLYPDVAEALGLSREEVDRFFDLFAGKQMAEINLNSERWISEAVGARDQGTGPSNRRQQALQRELDESIAALLGNSRQSLWKEYELTRGHRYQARSLATQLAQEDQPLSSAQLRAVTTVVIAEGQRQQLEMNAMSRRYDQADPNLRPQIQEEIIRRGEDSRARIIDAAAPQLSAQQVAILREKNRVQNALNKATQRIQKEHDKSYGRAQ